ncbi:redox-active disulfide protein 2 [Flavobacterium foetidum]|uniref:redox-active disulfide protein 2 n=1 Tax=Flavobacterium foetidum TaxID=2026681 RepID=UPI00107537E9|nr:redox-active disulfide protein 2 [Flavobacterium foetidum]KAF2511893.1 redox-active disulfide protein 2 [Flavobacterium foetidum]
MKKKFNEMTSEELIKTHKTLKTVTYLFGVILFVLFVLNIFLVANKGFSASNIIPIALLPIFILNMNTLKEIKKELESRGQQS